MKAADLRDKSVDELRDELVALRREQFNLRMSQATGELAQVHEHGRVRKDVARIKTVINERSPKPGKKKASKKK